MMSSIHQPPVFGMMLDVTLNRSVTEAGPPERSEVKFRLIAFHPMSFAVKWATLTHGPESTITSTYAWSVSVAFAVSVRERSYLW